MSDISMLSMRQQKAINVSFAAEQSLLGAFMLVESSYDDCPLLAEGDFSGTDHATIFRAIRDLRAANKRTDVISVAERLDYLGQLESVGGMTYLGQLAGAMPSAPNVRHYAEITRSHSLLRKAINYVYDTISIAAGDGEPQDIVAEIQKGATALTEQAGVDEFEHVSQTVCAALEEMQRRMDSGKEIAGIETGFPDYDRRTGGLKPGEVIVIAGAPGMGKTTFAYNIAENVALAGHSVLTISLEMSKVQLGLRHLASVGGVPLPSMQSANMEEDDYTRLTAATAKLHESKLYTVNASAMNPARLAALARSCKRKHGLDLLVIDYLGLMTTEGKKNSELERLTELTRSIKLLAKEVSVPVLLLCQINREVLKGADKRPHMHHLRDSGSIEQDADVVTFLYRDEVYSPDSQYKGVAEIITRKCRMGEVGTDMAYFDGAKSKFKPLAKDWIPDAPQPRFSYANAKRGGE